MNILYVHSIRSHYKKFLCVLLYCMLVHCENSVIIGDYVDNFVDPQTEILLSVLLNLFSSQGSLY